MPDEGLGEDEVRELIGEYDWAHIVVAARTHGMTPMEFVIEAIDVTASVCAITQEHERALTPDEAMGVFLRARRERE